VERNRNWSHAKKELLNWSHTPENQGLRAWSRSHVHVKNSSGARAVSFLQWLHNPVYIIQVFGAFDWPSSISGSNVMPKKQNTAKMKLSKMKRYLI